MFKCVFAAGVFSLAAFSAQADVDVRAALTGFNVQLIDLDPVDGIAPALTFGSGWLLASASNSLPNGSSTYDSVYYTSPFHADSRSATLGPLTSGFQFNAANGLDGLKSSVAAGTSNDVAEPRTSLGATANMGVEFTLTPQTQMILSFTAMADVQSSMHADSHYLNSVLASASATIEGDGGGAGSVHINVSPNTWNVAEHQEQSFVLAYSNDATLSRTGFFQTYVGVSQWVTEVPEPATSGLFASGAALFALLARRRRVTA